MVETSRIRYQQLEKQNGKKINEPAKVKNILNSCIHEYFQGLESKVQKQRNKINELEANIEKKLDKFKKDILDAISQSLKSAVDVNQKVLSPR